MFSLLQHELVNQFTLFAAKPHLQFPFPSATLRSHDLLLASEAMSLVRRPIGPMTIGPKSENPFVHRPIGLKLCFLSKNHWFEKVCHLPTAHSSEKVLLVRKPIGPTARWSDGPLVRKPIGLTLHWSESVIGPKTIGPKNRVIGLMDH